MTKKRMTLDELERARDRAVRMFENFDDDESAEEFASMSPEEYAEFKGIEIIASNPTISRRDRKEKNMATKKQATVELEDTIKDIYDVVQESGSTRAAMEASLDQIAGLCTGVLPELAETDETDEADDEENDEE